jgi:hypothetical protein
VDTNNNIGNAWDFYKTADASLQSRSQTFLITQAILVAAYAALLLFNGDRDTEIVFFVVSLQVAGLAIYLAVTLGQKTDSMLAVMASIRHKFLERADVFGEGTEPVSGGRDHAPDYAKTLPDAFVMFWIAAIVAGIVLFIITMQALPTEAAVH